MKQWVALIIAIAFFMASVPVYALDLTMPDALHGEQVAAGSKLDQWNEQLVYEDELNERTAYERDKTNDTIALVAWGLVLLMALTLDSGDDGEDGEPGPPGPPGPPGDDGGCHW